MVFRLGENCALRESVLGHGVEPIVKQLGFRVTRSCEQSETLYPKGVLNVATLNIESLYLFLGRSLHAFDYSHIQLRLIVSYLQDRARALHARDAKIPFFFVTLTFLFGGSSEPEWIV